MQIRSETRSADSYGIYHRSGSNARELDGLVSKPSDWTISTVQLSMFGSEPVMVARNQDKQYMVRQEYNHA